MTRGLQSAPLLRVQPQTLRVVLLNPGNSLERVMGMYAKAMQPVVPTGLAYLAAVLRHAGHRVHLVDHYLSAEPIPELVRRVARLEPDVIGLSVLTPAAEAASRIVRALRAAIPRAFFVWGNIHSSVFAEDILQEELADAIVHGEGEKTMLELAQCLASGQPLEGLSGLSTRGSEWQAIHHAPRAPIEDLDSLPFPAFDLLPLHRYVAPPFLGWMEPILPVQASRGCRFDCTFCSQERLSPGLRLRHPEAVVEEMEYHHRRYHIRYMGFLDANFPSDREQALAFAECFMRKGLHKRIRWLTETRVDLIDDQLMAILARAGLRFLMLGFESGAQRMLDGFSKRQSLEASVRAMAAAKRHGVIVLGLFLLGMPGETLVSAEETVAFALSLEPDFAKFNLAVPYPGSRFFEEWRQTHPGPLDFDRFSAWIDRRRAPEVLYVPEGMTSSQLLDLRDSAMRRFYLRPHFLLSHLLQGTLQVPGILRGIRVFGRSILSRQE